MLKCLHVQKTSHNSYVHFCSTFFHSLSEMLSFSSCLLKASLLNKPSLLWLVSELNESKARLVMHHNHRMYIKDGQRPFQSLKIEVKLMQKWLKPALILAASRGRLLWLQNEVGFCRSLWENDHTSHLICYLCKRFLLSLWFKLLVSRLCQIIVR